MLSSKIRQKQKIIFTRSFNPNHVINLSKFTHSLENTSKNKTVQLATRKPKNLPKILTKAKFEENLYPLQLKKLDFFSVMILFITDVDISNSATLFNLK